MNDTLQKILNIGIALSKEKDRERLLDRILTSAVDMTRCDAGTLYINSGDMLEFKIMITKSRGIHQGGVGDEITMPPVPLSEENVCACAAIYRRLINIPNVYECTQYDFSGPKNYDRLTGYHTESMMVVPMEDDRGRVIGVMQLINAIGDEGEIVPFCTAYEHILYAMGSQAAICLANMNYSQQIRAMLDSYVKVMSTAIDARTPYNANHSKNMAAYAKNFITWLNGQGLEWNFDEDRADEFLMSVWLHDIGKLITPLEVMNKQSRLAGDYRIVMDRLDKISLLARIDSLEGRTTADAESAIQDDIKKARELIDRVNNAPIVTDEMADELDRLARRSYIGSDGSRHPWITDGEYEQLSIRKGTLTHAERMVMQDHVKMTCKMLEQMEFGDSYRNLLTWASQHHELLDGSGYPNGLKGDEICREVRLLTILDVFEAMTSRDRPYKSPVPAEDAMAILHEMADNGKIDPWILDLFEQSRAWLIDLDKGGVEE